MVINEISSRIADLAKTLQADRKGVLRKFYDFDKSANSFMNPYEKLFRPGFLNEEEKVIVVGNLKMGLGKFLQKSIDEITKYIKEIPANGDVPQDIVDKFRKNYFDKFRPILTNDLQYHLMNIMPKYNSDDMADPKLLRALIGFAELKVREISKLLKDYSIYGIEHRAEYVILVSRHPMDIVRMQDHEGFGRSCHSEGGCYFKSAIDEMGEGAIVVYLISMEDYEKIKDDPKLQTKEIFKDASRDVPGIIPISRMRMRKMEYAPTGDIYFIPYSKTYGKQVQWISRVFEIAREMQPDMVDFFEEKGEVDPYKFTILGGSYDDTQGMWTDEFRRLFPGLSVIDNDHNRDPEKEEEEEEVWNENGEFLNDLEHQLRGSTFHHRTGYPVRLSPNEVEAMPRRPYITFEGDITFEVDNLLYKALRGEKYRFANQPIPIDAANEIENLIFYAPQRPSGTTRLRRWVSSSLYELIFNEADGGVEIVGNNGYRRSFMVAFSFQLDIGNTVTQAQAVDFIEEILYEFLEHYYDNVLEKIKNNIGVLKGIVYERDA